MALSKNMQPGKTSTTADRQYNSVKDAKKQQGISNSGGQTANQTDNKQATVNKGNTDPNVEGKNN